MMEPVGSKQNGRKRQDPRLGNTLETLIEANRAAIEGFDTAIENISEFRFKSSLKKLRGQQFDLIEELKEHHEKHDYFSNDSASSYLRSLPSGWADVTAQFTGGDPSYVLSDMVRLVKTLENLYKDALEASVNDELEELLKKHRHALGENLEILEEHNENA